MEVFVSDKAKVLIEAESRPVGDLCFQDNLQAKMVLPKLITITFQLLACIISQPKTHDQGPTTTLHKPHHSHLQPSAEYSGQRDGNLQDRAT